MYSMRRWSRECRTSFCWAIKSQPVTARETCWRKRRKIYGPGSGDRGSGQRLTSSHRHDRSHSAWAPRRRGAGGAGRLWRAPAPSELRESSRRHWRTTVNRFLPRLFPGATALGFSWNVSHPWSREMWHGSEQRRHSPLSAAGVSSRSYSVFYREFVLIRLTQICSLILLSFL